MDTFYFYNVREYKKKTIINNMENKFVWQKMWINDFYMVDFKKKSRIGLISLLFYIKIV